MQIQSIQVPAPAGSTNNNVYVWQQIQPGAILRMVQARDGNRGATPVRIAMVPSAAVNVTGNKAVVGGIPANHLALRVEQQGGFWEWVQWEGSIPVSADYPILVAQFEDAVDADNLYLTYATE